MDFDAFREHGRPTYYPSVHLPWEADLLVCGLIFCFCILFFSFCLLVPGIAGKEKFLFISRIFISLTIGASILITNFAMTWETAETSTTTKYKAGTGQEINATIGVNIGLRGVNITLKADEHELEGETINYNEQFGWEGLQGRLGFGPFAGRFNREYRAAQFRGLPLPILWVAEYFTLDGEGIRWGRHYRQAGWYSHIMLWLAFPLWVLTNILFFMLLRYGAYFMILTGLSMVSANIIWATHRNVLDLKIPFTEDGVLEFSYGASFWICLATGLVCFLFGIVIFIMDKCMPKEIALFFGVDILQDSERIQVEDDSEPTVVTDRETYMVFDNNEESNDLPASPADEADDIYEDSTSVPLPSPGTRPEPAISKHRRPLSIVIPSVPQRSFRTGEHRLTKRFQRPRRREPPSQYPTPVTTGGISLETFRTNPDDDNRDSLYSYATS